MSIHGRGTCAPDCSGCAYGTWFDVDGERGTSYRYERGFITLFVEPEVDGDWAWFLWFDGKEVVRGLAPSRDEAKVRSNAAHERASVDASAFVVRAGAPAPHPDRS